MVVPDVAVSINSRHQHLIAMTIKTFRLFLLLLAVFIAPASWAEGQSTQAVAQATQSVAQTLAPSGELKVGVYLGSPTSLLIDPHNGKPYGVAVGLGEALAEALERPVRIVRFERVAQVIEALKNGQVDMTFTNATPARAIDVDFTAPLIRLELGVLVSERLSLSRIAQLDDARFRVGVAKGSSSQSALPKHLTLAQIVPVDSLDQAQKMLAASELDGFATNKAILFELNERLSGFKVLDDRWGLEHLAIAIPKGRDAAIPFLADFAKQQVSTGAVQAHAQRAGLRGLAKD